MTFGSDGIGTSSISLPPNSKTETTPRTLPGLSGMGLRGSAQFTATRGNVAVPGLRFGECCEPYGRLRQVLVHGLDILREPGKDQSARQQEEAIICGS